jgi:4-amino-4-deoxy-L-arabinose transferase-like glycosyltransferase
MSETSDAGAPQESQVFGTNTALVGIGVMAVALRIAFFTGYHGYDDVHYIGRAVELSQGRFDLPTTAWEARLGIVGPAALGFWAFGIGPVVANLFPLACSLLGIAFTFVFCRTCYGTRAALAAAFLLAILPIDVLSSSMLFPTAPVSLGWGVGIGCFLLAEDGHRPWLYLASGVAIAFAALAHEVALVACIGYLAYVVAVARPNRWHALVLVGLAAICIDPIVHGAMGDPWVHVTVLQATQTVRGVNSDVAYSGLNLAWIGEPIVRVFVDRTAGLFLWLLAPLVAYRLWRPNVSGDRALPLLLLSVFLWISYGSVSITSYAPLSRLSRYMAPLFLPATWFLGRELAALNRPRAVVAAGLLGLNSLLCLSLDSGSALPPVPELASVLRQLNPSVVFVPRGTTPALQLVEGFNAPYRVEPFDSTVIPSGLVVASDANTRSRIEAIAGVKLLARLRAPDTWYVRALRNQAVLAVLEKTRPKDRFATYADKVAPRVLNVYRVPEPGLGLESGRDLR